MAGRCVFCDLDPARLSWASELVVALRDAYPVSPGHTLILPRRHVPTWFDASAEEQRALWEGVEVVTSPPSTSCITGAGACSSSLTARDHPTGAG